MRPGPLRRLLRLEEQRLEVARLRLAAAARNLAHEVGRLEGLRTRRADLLGAVPREAAWLSLHAAFADRLARELEAAEGSRRAAEAEMRRRSRDVAARLARRRLLGELEARASEEAERRLLARERAELDDLAAGRLRAAADGRG